MTIITIPNKSLIRWLPVPPGLSGDGAVEICRRPSLAVVDSSRILMTYEAEHEAVQSIFASNSATIAACYLDEEFIANAQSNSILDLNTDCDGRGAHSFRLFCGGGRRILGVFSHDLKKAIVRMYMDDHPDTLGSGTPATSDRCGAMAFPFVWNGTVMALTDSHKDLLALFRDGASWSCKKARDVQLEINPPSISSGFAPSGGGWTTFMTRPAKGCVAIYQATLTVDPLVLGCPLMCGVMSRVDWLGTPIRHAEGWALPFDDGSGVCKIALIADSEIE